MTLNFFSFISMFKNYFPYKIIRAKGKRLFKYFTNTAMDTLRWENFRNSNCWLAGTSGMRKLQMFSQMMDESPHSAQERQFWGSSVYFTEVLISVKISYIYNTLSQDPITSQA